MVALPIWLQHWVSVWLKKASSPVRRRPTFTRLRVEQLEDRAVPSNCSAGSTLGNSTASTTTQDTSHSVGTAAWSSTQSSNSTTQSPTGYRSIDGIGNNLANPNWGSAGNDLL